MKRYGYFFLSQKLLQSESREKIRAIFVGLIILQTDYRYDRMGTVYLAEGEQFEPVEEGSIAPDYDVEIDANRTVTFTKRENQTYGH